MERIGEMSMEELKALTVVVAAELATRWISERGAGYFASNIDARTHLMAGAGLSMHVQLKPSPAVW